MANLEGNNHSQVEAGDSWNQYTTALSWTGRPLLARDIVNGQGRKRELLARIIPVIWKQPTDP